MLASTPIFASIHDSGMHEWFRKQGKLEHESGPSEFTNVFEWVLMESCLHHSPRVRSDMF